MLLRNALTVRLLVIILIINVRMTIILIVIIMIVVMIKAASRVQRAQPSQKCHRMSCSLRMYVHRLHNAQWPGPSMHCL